MKNKIIILIILTVVIAGVCYARNIAWRKTEKPPVELRDALIIAKEEMKKQGFDDRYYCLNAQIGMTFSNGDWLLHYSSKNGDELWVNVASDKKVLISKEGFNYY